MPAQPKDLKLPPQSMQAEQAVIGGLIIDNSSLERVIDKLNPHDFYRRGHQIIFEKILDFAQKNIPFDIITLAEALKSKNLLDKTGGIEYLIQLANDTPSSANIAAYASIVRDFSVERDLLAVGGDIADAVYNKNGRNTAQLLEFAEHKVLHIADMQNKSAGGFEPIKTILVSTLSKVEQAYESDTAIIGVSTGFVELDNATAGLNPSDLIIVAARPSAGKTAFSMNIAEEVALNPTEKAVAVFSLEMPKDAITLRLLSSLSGIDGQRLRTGRVDKSELLLLKKAENTLANAKLFIDDTPALSPLEMRARARRLARDQGGLGLIVVDYMQLMTSPSSSNNEVDRISDISRGLKALAKELNVPVIALSQLNRNLEQRPNKRPVMSDLRSSGAIEQDADLILFLYRDEVYNPNSPDKGTAEVIIGKQRNGPLATVRLNFNNHCTRFENFIGDYHD